METWKPISCTEDKFSVSDQGRVRRESTKVWHSGVHGHYQTISQRILTPIANGLKRQITLQWKDSDNVSHVYTDNVENIVWQEFIGGHPLLYHKNGDTLDDRLENLSTTSQFAVDVDEQCTWRDIPGTHGYYQVSDLGHVRSCERYTQCSNGYVFVPSTILNPYVDPSGYQHVYLRVDGVVVDWLLHRAVASAFIANPDNLPYINHKNFNRCDNSVHNLEWCTPQYNVNYSKVRNRYNVPHPSTVQFNKRTKSKPVTCIELALEFSSMTACEQYFKFPAGSISSAIKANRSYRNYHFKLTEC